MLFAGLCDNPVTRFGDDESLELPQIQLLKKDKELFFLLVSLNLRTGKKTLLVFG